MNLVLIAIGAAILGYLFVLLLSALTIKTQTIQLHVLSIVGFVCLALGLNI